MTPQHVWDELDMWHSRLAQLESDAQDLEKPEDTVTVTDRLTEVQQLHSQLAKQAEQRTALVGKVRTEATVRQLLLGWSGEEHVVLWLRSSHGSRNIRR